MHVGLVFITGAPGCSKGTQGRILSENYTFVEHIEFSKYLVHASERNDDLAAQIQNQISQGMLIESAICNSVFDMYIRDRIERAYYNRTLVLLDGFPRSRAQLEHLLFSFRGRVFGHIFLDGPKNMFENRIRSRLAKEGRRDDALNIIAERFAQYEQNTLPVIQSMLTSVHMKSLRIYQNPNTTKERIAKRIRQFLGLPRPKNGRSYFVGPMPASASV